MKTICAFVIAGSLIVSSAATGQDLSRYRDYVLESSVVSITSSSGARATEIRTLHQRPVSIKELRWRAPYIYNAAAPVDSVREITFSFYDDSLYQMIVHYDRDRTEGLTDDDIVDSLSRTYGDANVTSEPDRPARLMEAWTDTVVLARWEDTDSLVTLARGTYAPEFRLIVMSKSLSGLATTAIREAVRLNTLEAPQREAARRKLDAEDAHAALDKKRSDNKATFRP